MEDLKELRKTAEEATQGNWMWVNDRDDERIRAGKFPYHHVTYTDDVVDENALYIATFDPPTVLALLSRLEQAEKDANTYQTLYEQRAESLEQAEQALQRVRETSAHRKEIRLDYVDLIDLDRALDGDGRG